MAERQLWSERWERKREACPHCGRPRSECSDRERAFYPQRDVCYATMERQSSAARYAQLHEDLPYHDGTFKSWAKERSASHPVHFNDGVTIWVADTDLNPHDHFLGGASACPECREKEAEHGDTL